jgi:small subunit ribosomal protein S6
MRKYELMTIHRPEFSEDEVKAKIAEIEKFLGDHGAKVESTDLWGKRRFTYEIKHVREGHYSVVTFDAETATVDEIDRVLSLADAVLRHKIVRPGA